MPASATPSEVRVGSVSYFAVEIDGSIIANFAECSGLSATVKVETYEEGGLNYTPLKFPARGDFGNLTLKRGITESSDLYDWFLQVLGGVLARKPLSVILMTEDLNELTRWEFAGAFPVKWTGPALNAKGSGVSIEQLEIAHEGLISI